MDKPSFVYTTFIRSTHERVWQALTDPAFTERYWGVAFDSDWNPGSSMTVRQWGLTIGDPDQVVLESEPYRRFAYIWHTFTPEWQEQAAERVGFSKEFLERVAAEPRSKVAFEIDDLGEFRQARGDPRRLRARKRGLGDHQPRVAAHPLQSQDAARDRRHPARDPSFGRRCPSCGRMMGTDLAAAVPRSRRTRPVRDPIRVLR